MKTRRGEAEQNTAKKEKDTRPETEEPTLKKEIKTEDMVKENMIGKEETMSEIQEIKDKGGIQEKGDAPMKGARVDNLVEDMKFTDEKEALPDGWKTL